MESMDPGYRSELETRIGGSVVAYAMAARRLGGSDRDLEWGLLALTEAVLAFTVPPSTHWLASFRGPFAQSTPPSYPVDLLIPFAAIASVDSPRSGLLGRLFGPGYEPLVVRWNAAAGVMTESFSVNPGGGFIGALSEAVGRRSPAKA